MCLIDIDTGMVEPPEDLPAYPHTDDIVLELKDLCVRYNIVLQEGEDDSGV